MRKSQAPTLIKYGPARAADCYLDLFISRQEFNSSAAILLNNQVVSSCQLLFFSWFVLCKLFFFKLFERNACKLTREVMRTSGVNSN